MPVTPQCAHLQLPFLGTRCSCLAAAYRRSLPVIAYESMELNMAAAIEQELNLPQHVRDFNIDTLLKSLGYTTQPAGSDVIMRPPGKPVIPGRRRVLAMPPHRR